MDNNLDYEGLKKAGLDYIQKVSSKLWTDHNAHDPGITMLEQLCFGLVDLGFRTSFDIKELLTKEGTNVPATEKALYPAHEILSSAPITIEDYRKMILENFRDMVRNVHFTTTTRNYTIDKEVLSAKENVNIEATGYYKCFVDLKKDFSEKEVKQLETDIMNLLSNNRNICENFCGVTFTKQLKVGLIAQIELESEADYSAITRELEVRLNSYVSPSIPYYTYEELEAKGKTVDEIFLGTAPIYGNGFIDRDDLPKQIKRKVLYSSDVKNLILTIDGVKSVRHFEFTVDDNARRTRIVTQKSGKFTRQALDKFKDRIIEECWSMGMFLDSFYENDDLVLVHRNELVGNEFVEMVAPMLEREGLSYYIITPEVTIDEDWIELQKEDLSFVLNHITLKKNDISRLVYIINGIPFAVGRQLKYTPSNWDEVGRQPKTNKKVALDIPEGRYRKIDKFYSVQHQLTENYMVGKQGISEKETTERKVQRLQLKAYLTFFDQLLADYLAQLSSLDTLFSWKEDNTSYFHHVLTDDEVKDVEMVLHDYHGYEQVIGTEKALAQKNAILNHMLARFNEEFVDYSVFKFFQNTGFSAKQFGFDIAETVRDKKAFLDNYIAISGSRAQGTNLLSYDSTHKWNISACEERIMRRVGVNTKKQRSLLAAKIINKKIRDVYPGYNTTVLRNCFASTSSDEITPKDVAKYKGEKPKIATRLVYYKGKWTKKYILMDGSESRDFSEAFGVRLLEHSLLVPYDGKKFDYNTFLRLTTDGSKYTLSHDPFTCQVTAICPGWLRITRNSHFRQIVESVIREEIPAHISVKICWLSQGAMLNAEERYSGYLAALNGKSRLSVDCALEGLVLAFDGMKNIYPPTMTFDYGASLISAFADDITQIDYSAVGDAEQIVLESIRFAKKEITMVVSTKLKLKIEKTPKNIRANIAWTSSNRSVATVNEDGLVWAADCGKTRITASDGNGHTCSCIITVCEQ